jgi:hypothetical protein
LWKRGWRIKLIEPTPAATPKKNVPRIPILNKKIKRVTFPSSFASDGGRRDIDAGIIEKAAGVKFISSKDQLADIFTKPLPLPTFEDCRRNLNLLCTSGHS